MYRDIMNNKIFYQHPNLMRALGIHETVMEVMVNVLGEGESKVRDKFTFMLMIQAITCTTKHSMSLLLIGYLNCICILHGMN